MTIWPTAHQTSERDTIEE